jgi:hypothetical protein
MVRVLRGTNGGGQEALPGMLLCEMGQGWSRCGFVGALVEGMKGSDGAGTAGGVGEAGDGWSNASPVS